MVKGKPVVICGKPIRFAHEDRCEDCFAEDQQRFVGKCQSHLGHSRISPKNRRVNITSWTEAELDARPVNYFSEARK